MLQKQAESWHEFWETRALSLDPLLASDFVDVVQGEQKHVLMCQELRALLDLQPSDVFLNVGCGAGLFESSLNSDGRRIVGLDLAWNMLLLAQRLNGSKPSLLLVQGTATNLPFVGPTFDKVLANSVTHYLSADQLSLMLTDLKRVLKPGGRIVIGDIEEPSLPFMNRLKRIRAREGLSGLLRRSLRKVFTLAWRLYQRGHERYLVARGGYHPLAKPTSIIRYAPDEILRRAADLGFQARVVRQERGVLYPNRFNVVISGQ